MENSNTLLILLNIYGVKKYQTVKFILKNTY